MSLVVTVDVVALSETGRDVQCSAWAPNGTLLPRGVVTPPDRQTFPKSAEFAVRELYTRCIPETRLAVLISATASVCHIYSMVDVQSCTRTQGDCGIVQILLDSDPCGVVGKRDEPRSRETIHFRPCILTLHWERYEVANLQIRKARLALLQAVSGRWPWFNQSRIALRVLHTTAILLAPSRGWIRGRGCGLSADTVIIRKLATCRWPCLYVGESNAAEDRTGPRK